MRERIMRILRRLAYWWRFDANSGDLGEELAFHREALKHDLIARGHSPADAHDAARRAMGNETLMRESSRGVWIWPSLEAIWQDAKVSLRSLRRSPAFTVGVMLTFALGFRGCAGRAARISAMKRASKCGRHVLPR